MFDLEILKSVADKNSFTYAYRIPAIYNLSGFPKALTLANCSGSLMACGFLTKYSHNTTASDKETEEDFIACNKSWLSLHPSAVIEPERQKAFEANREIDEKLENIKQITAEAIKKEQRRMFG